MQIPTYTSGLLFTKAHKAVRLRIYDVLEKYDLNPTYWSILGATAQASEGIRLARVAEIVDMTAPMITVMANDLTEKGLIKRVPHHSDGRAKLLVMTPRGKKLAAAIEEELAATIAGLLRGLSSAEIVTFQKILAIIISNAETKD